MAVRLPVILLFMLAAALAWTETAGELERVLAARELSCAEGAWFVLSSLPGDPPENPEAAFALARERGWLGKNAGAEESLDLGHCSLLVMGAFEVEGGLMYRLFPVRRYAFREMVRAGYIEGRSYPATKVSGDKFLEILGRVLYQREDTETPK